jgi:hypothetical protein
LLGIDLDIFDIGAIDEGDFYVKFHLCNKDTDFKWALVAIYGAAQSNLKEQFLIELVHLRIVPYSYGGGGDLTC